MKLRNSNPTYNGYLTSSSNVKELLNETTPMNGNLRRIVMNVPDRVSEERIDVFLINN
jgi:hypothetical protein